MSKDDCWATYITMRNFASIKDASARWNCVKLILPRRMFSLPLPKQPRIIPVPLRKLLETEIVHFVSYGRGLGRLSNLYEALGFALVLNDNMLVETIILALVPCSALGIWKAPDWEAMPVLIREAFFKVQGDDISNVYDTLVSNRTQGNTHSNIESKTC